MSSFLIFKKLTQQEAEETISQLEKWFKENPKRKICRTDLFKVRKNHVREDVMEHTITKENSTCDIY